MCISFSRGVGESCVCMGSSRGVGESYVCMGSSRGWERVVCAWVLLGG